LLVGGRTAHERQSAASRLACALLSYQQVVQTRSYFPLWLGQLISNFGDTLHYIALVVLVFRLSGQGLAVGGVVAAEVLPLLILGPFAGVIVDRFNRKHVLIASDVCRALLALSLVWPQGVWHAYVVAAGMAAAGSFSNPAFQAIIPMVTTERQRLAANSVAWSTGRLVQIVASAVAGGLIAVIGTGPAFLANAISFAVSALFVSRLRLTALPREAAVTAVARRWAEYAADVGEAFQHVAASRFLTRLFLVQALASLATGGTSAMLVVLAERHLGLPPSGFAWLIGAIGVGALLGPLIPNMLQAELGGGRWLYVPYVLRGAGDILLAAITPIPMALVLLFIYGLNTSTGVVVFNSTLQTRVPDRLRGRVFALFDMTWGVCRLVSLVLGGVIVDVAGVQQLYWAGGAILTLAGAIGLTEGLRRAREAGGQR
jgi:MFS family permease